MPVAAIGAPTSSVRVERTRTGCPIQSDDQRIRTLCSVTTRSRWSWSAWSLNTASSLTIFLGNGAPGRRIRITPAWGKVLPDDQRAEVQVGGDQKPALARGDAQHRLVIEAGGVVAGDRLDIMALAGEMRDQAEVGALVEEEPHTPT